VPILKKTAVPSAARFVVPSLADASPEYAALVRRQAELNASYASLLAEKRRLEKEVAADPAPRIRPGVAALLGDDPVDSRSAKLSRLADLRQAASDHETALATIQRRIAEATGPASAKVRAAVKPEFARRVAVLCQALAAVDDAREAYEQIRIGLDAEGVEWTALGPVGLGFLGDRVDGRSFQIQRVLREAREDGHV